MKYHRRIKTIDRVTSAVIGVSVGMLILAVFVFLPLMAFTEYVDRRVILLIPAFALTFGTVFYTCAGAVKNFINL